MNPDNERKQERFRIRRDRERQARAQETAEEKEVRLAKHARPMTPCVTLVMTFDLQSLHSRTL